MISRSLKTNRLVIAFDGLCALALVLTSAVYGNIARIPGSIEHFLQMRVTLLNVAFASLFVLGWISFLNVLGLYRLDSDSVLRKLSTVAKACAVMATALCVFLIISRTQGPPRRIAFIFFASSFLVESARIIGYSVVRAWVASRDPRRVLIV